MKILLQFLLNHILTNLFDKPLEVFPLYFHQFYNMDKPLSYSSEPLEKSIKWDINVGHEVPIRAILKWHSRNLVIKRSCAYLIYCANNLEAEVFLIAMISVTDS